MSTLSSFGRLAPQKFVCHWHASLCNFSSAQIPGAAGAWYVSSWGRIKVASGSVTYGSLTRSGYRAVCIARARYQVHRLVATTFLGLPPTADHWQVNHVDGDRSNNHVHNLEWATASQNAAHSWSSNLQRRTGGTLRRKSVLWRLCGDEAWSWCSSQREAALTCGVSRQSVSNCCRGLQKSAAGDSARYEFESAASPTEHDILHGESWKLGRHPGETPPIPGLMVSNHGRVRFLTRHHSHTTCGSRQPDGYFRIKAGGRHYKVHRLVAGTFLGEPASMTMQVNHKDGNPGNNTLANLEYVTPSENVSHSYANGRAGKSGTSKAVEARRKEANVGWAHFPSIRAAAVHTGIKESAISAICKMQAPSSTPYHWEFRFPVQEALPGEEWRPVVLEGARVQGQRPGTS